MERVKTEPEIIVHSDDFGACEEVTENIMDVYRKARLNSVSILVNGLDFDRSMLILREHPDLKYSIHYNITEGPALCGHENTTLLTNDEGMFLGSFFRVLIKSYLPGAKKLKAQIKAELMAQTKKLLEKEDELGMKRLDEWGVRLIRIDSHQHFHMIPAVMKCILEICDELELGVEFIRVPAEPLGPYFKHPGLLRTYRPINFIKNRVLAVLAVMNHKRLKPYRKSKSALFMGMMMSCEMDTKRVKELLPEFKKKAAKKHMKLEILAHPGQCSEEEQLMDRKNQLCKEFYMSEKRMTEKDCLLNLFRE